MKKGIWIVVAMIVVLIILGIAFWGFGNKDYRNYVPNDSPCDKYRTKEVCNSVNGCGWKELQERTTLPAGAEIQATCCSIDALAGEFDPDDVCTWEIG